MAEPKLLNQKKKTLIEVVGEVLNPEIGDWCLTLTEPFICLWVGSVTFACASLGLLSYLDIACDKAFLSYNRRVDAPIFSLDEWLPLKIEIH